MTRLIDTLALEDVLQKFADERDWNRYHTPKNLAMALTGEVGELVEILQWMSDDEARAASSDPRIRAALSDELADVMLYLVRLAAVLDIDIDTAVTTKLAANARKYPPGDSRLKRNG